MMPTDMRRDATEWLLLYDAECSFCRWALDRVLRADRHGQFRPIDLNSPEARELLSDLNQEQRMSSWHLIAPDGRRWSAGRAAPPLFRLLPGGRVPAALFEAAPRLTERAYRWVDKHRPALAKLIPGRSKQRADERLEART
jgi:predicted DCC family thiol-disulfide oxidoreductase YuxK